jgi:hypothetical protein
MRFGRDETAFLKPEDNGGWDWEGEESEGGEEMAEVGIESMVVYDPVEDDRKPVVVKGKEEDKKKIQSMLNQTKNES